MKQIYLALMTLAFSVTVSAQVVSIGFSPYTPIWYEYTSPWSPAHAYSYVQTIYLQSEINVAGLITSIRFKYEGPTLDKSNELKVYMGTSTRTSFQSNTDWEPFSNLTKVYDGTVPTQPVTDWITIDLTQPYDYKNDGNLVIAVDENEPGDDFAGNDSDAFRASDLDAPRVIYYDSDSINPDPANVPTAQGTKNFVGNIQIVFGLPTPVTLSNFSGEKLGSSNKLTWTTVTEQNNKGFELQRSADGTTFSSIAFIRSKAAGGNSNAGLSYSFTDDNHLSGNNHYRLRQVDLDGKATVSKVVTLNSSAGRMALSVIYPNPTTNDLNMILTSRGNDKATIYITDVSGKVVYRNTRSVTTGDNKLNLNPSRFAPGIYTIKAVYAGSKESVISKFIKQ